MKFSFPLLSLFSSAIALKLLVPLYIYPLPDAWAPLVSAIEAHPTTPFQIIVNPNSGPGDGAFPDDTYAAAIAQLRAFPNVELVGYVHVLWGERDAATLTKEIDTYAGWTEYSGADISLDGIFFDEAPSVDDDSIIAYMEALSTHAQQVIGGSPAVPQPTMSACGSKNKNKNNSTAPAPSSGDTITIFNMGTAPQSTRYFDAGSQVVVMEWAYADYSADKLAASVPSGSNAAGQTHVSASSVILHSFSGTDADLADFFAAANDLGFQTAYATADCCYNSIGAVGGSGGIQAVAEAFASVVA